MLSNLFKDLPDTLPNEIVDNVLVGQNFRVDRILSKGHSSPAEGWYDQEDNEWVILLQGEAIIEYQDGTQAVLKKGDYLNIPAHVKHKVKWTHPKKMSIWLAIFY